MDPHHAETDPLAGGLARVLDGDRGRRHRRRMNELLVGYARVFTEQQDLTAQCTGRHALDDGDDRIYFDHGRTPTSRGRPGSDWLSPPAVPRHFGGHQARLAGPLAADARDILDELRKRNVKLSLGGSNHDPTDPVGGLLLDVLAMVSSSKPT